MELRKHLTSFRLLIIASLVSSSVLLSCNGETKTEPETVAPMEEPMPETAVVDSTDMDSAKTKPIRTPN